MKEAKEYLEYNLEYNKEYNYQGIHTIWSFTWNPRTGVRIHDRSQNVLALHRGGKVTGKGQNGISESVREVVTQAYAIVEIHWT